MRPARSSIHASALLLATLVGARMNWAQEPVTRDKPVVLLHGFGSNGSTWAKTALALRRQLRVRPFAPSVDPKTSMYDQANDLGAKTNAHFPGTTNDLMPFVGHSQGGLVERAYARAGGSRINALVTVGSPHSGAPIAQNALNGNLIGDFIYVHANAAFPVDYYRRWDPDFNLPGVGAALEAFLDFSNLVTFYLNPFNDWVCQWAGLCVFVGQSIAPSMTEHIPGSTFHQQLQATNATELQKLGGNRFAIRSSVGSWNAMFRLVSPALSDAAAWAKSVTAGSYVLAYLQYWNHPNYLLRNNAWSWLVGAQAVLTWYDDAWSANVAGDLVSPHDGFIPVWSQTLNGGQLLNAQSVVAHTEQTESTEAEIRNALIASGTDIRPANSVAGVLVTPSPSTVAIGATLGLSAQPRDIFDQPLAGQGVSWVSRHPTIATVSPTGVVTGLKAGTAKIEAISDGYGGFAEITVGAGSPNPPVGPLTGVQIAGPSVAFPAQYFTLTAQPVGGTPPYHYAWFTEEFFPHSPWYQGPLATSYTSLAYVNTRYFVTVRDATGASVTASKDVTITSCGQYVC